MSGSASRSRRAPFGVSRLQQFQRLGDRQAHRLLTGLGEDRFHRRQHRPGSSKLGRKLPCRTWGSPTPISPPGCPPSSAGARCGGHPALRSLMGLGTHRCRRFRLDQGLQRVLQDLRQCVLVRVRAVAKQGVEMLLWFVKPADELLHGHGLRAARQWTTAVPAGAVTRSAQGLRG